MPSVLCEFGELYALILFLPLFILRRNFMNVATVFLSCLDFIVYLSMRPTIHAQRTFSLTTSEQSAISFSKTNKTSSYKEYER